jgi:surface carbohydrate biosynthesis protein
MFWVYRDVAAILGVRMNSKPSLIIPVENQVREFDSKLLLSCVAAERNFESFLGYRTELDYCIGTLPRSTYLCKSMTRKSRMVFRLLRQLGHEINVWDEEALVYLSDDHYFARRLTPQTLKLVSSLFAWGQDNEEVFRRYPHFDGTPIHVTGNPRIDLLRPELRGYFDEDVEKLRNRIGSFVLVNTNFSMVNGFVDSLNLFRRTTQPGEEPELGAPAIGTSREFAAGYAKHKSATFKAFVEMLPAICDLLPEHTIVVRPHPSESPTPWLEAADGHANLRIEHEGNVIPWLLAADALIHNGSTTAVEAHILGLPAIAYRPVENEPFDFALPNALSYESRNEEELCGTLRDVLFAQRGPSPIRTSRPFEEHVAGLSGALASDRIVDVLGGSEGVHKGLPKPPLSKLLLAQLKVRLRELRKRQNSDPDHHHNRAYQDHRFPKITVEEVEARITRLGRALNRFSSVRVHRVGDYIFRIDRD